MINANLQKSGGCVACMVTSLYREGFSFLIHARWQPVTHSGQQRSHHAVLDAWLPNIH